MDLLAVLFRASQLFAHKAHNLAKGPSFFADHDYLGSLYATYEDGYDAVVERMIGLGQTPNIDDINLRAAQYVPKIGSPSPNAAAFTSLLKLETVICSTLVDLNPSQSLGTQNLLQGFADASEARQYKLQQRIT